MRLLIVFILVLGGCTSVHKVVYSLEDYHVITVYDDTGKIVLAEPQESLHQCTMTKYILSKQQNDIYRNSITDPLPQHYIVTCSLLK